MGPYDSLRFLIASLDCNFILTILHVLVGFIQPSTTQWTKTLRNDLYLSKL